MWWKYHVLMYEDGKMTPVETIPGRGERGQRTMTEGVN
jgi:hypothetical protein